MQHNKKFDELKQMVISSLGDYINAANELYDAKRTEGLKNHLTLENKLDEKWEHLQLATSSCNHFVILELKAKACM